MGAVVSFDLAVLNRLRRAQGLAPLDELPAPSAPGSWLCSRCDAPMSENVWACPTCRAKEHADVQAEVAGPARDRALASIPATYADAARGSLELAQRCHEDAIRRAFEAPLAPTLILGPTGAGKSTLAAALLRHHIDTHPRGHTCRWLSAHDAVEAAAEHGLGDGQAPVLRAAERAAVLVLDDIGSERATVSNQAIASLAWARYDQARPTIYTSGFAPAKLVERYGDAFMRRLHDRGRIIIIRSRSQGA